MTFLQPFILWGLPLLLLPVLIHLFNRLRHRSVPWAAMMFLRSATRKSTRYARLRQFLILLFRVLAVLVLILALSRPLSGGWMGWMLAAAPDAIIVLFDRSATMEARDAAGVQNTKREEALKLLTQSARTFEKTSRVILIENVGRTPQEVPPSALADLPATTATDSAADLPAMMQVALDWLVQSKPGAAEVWIASDLQASNWDTESDRWPALASMIGTFPQRMRVRLLAMNREVDNNVAISLLAARQRRLEGRFELDLSFEIERTGPGAATLPVVLVVNGSRSTLDIRMDGPSLRYRHRMPLGADGATGWGYLELPADLNESDNRAYFVYGAPQALRAALVVQDEANIPYLQFATAPDPSNTNQVCETIAPNALEQVDWNAYSLVLWQRPLPEGALATTLESYVQQGGIMVFFPPGSPGSFQGVAWGDVQSTEDETGFVVARWDQQDGPLANSDEGLSLPVADLEVRRRQVILGDQTILAAFKDDYPLLGRRSLGEGEIFFCATLPSADWSRLGDGAVLVPMLQRLLLRGGERAGADSSVPAGTLTGDTATRWTSVDSAETKNPQTQAGIYRDGARLVAVNRPPQENETALADPERIQSLFGPASVQLFEEQGRKTTDLQSELWRLFLFLMAAFLLVEAILILPERRPAEELTGGRGGGEVASARRAEPEPVATALAR